MITVKLTFTCEGESVDGEPCREWTEIDVGLDEVRANSDEDDRVYQGFDTDAIPPNWSWQRLVAYDAAVPLCPSCTERWDRETLRFR